MNQIEYYCRLCRRPFLVLSGTVAECPRCLVDVEVVALVYQRREPVPDNRDVISDMWNEW